MHLISLVRPLILLAFPKFRKPVFSESEQHEKHTLLEGGLQCLRLRPCIRAKAPEHSPSMNPTVNENSMVCWHLDLFFSVYSNAPLGDFACKLISPSGIAVRYPTPTPALQSRHLSVPTISFTQTPNTKHIVVFTGACTWHSPTVVCDTPM